VKIGRGFDFQEVDSPELTFKFYKLIIYILFDVCVESRNARHHLKCTLLLKLFYVIEMEKWAGDHIQVIRNLKSRNLHFIKSFKPSSNGFVAKMNDNNFFFNLNQQIFYVKDSFYEN